MSINKFDTPKFSHMKCADILRNVTTTESKRLFRQMPFLEKLRRIPEFGPDMARYIILVYDKQSPFRPEFPNLADKKAAAAAFCGFKPNGPDGIYEAMTELTQEIVVDALCDFLKSQGSTVWGQIVTNEEVYLSNQRQLLLATDASKDDVARMRASDFQSKLLETQLVISKRLKALYVEFTGNDPDAEIAIMQHKPLRPETVADWEIPDEEYKAGFLYEEGEEVPGDPVEKPYYGLDEEE